MSFDPKGTFTATSTYGGTTALCVTSMHLMTDGSREDFERMFDPGRG